MEHLGSFISDNRHQERMGSKTWQQQQTDERSDQSSSSRQRQNNSVRQSNVSTEVPVHKDKVDMPFPVKPVYHRRTLCLGTQGSLNPHQLEKSSAPQPRGINNEYSGKHCNKKPLEWEGELLSNDRDVPTSQHRLSTEEEILNTKVIMYEKLCRIGGKLRENIQRERAASGEDLKSERHNSGQLEQDKERQKKTMAPPAERRSRESVRGTEMTRYEKTPEDLRQQREKKQVERNTDMNKSVREEEWHRRGGRTERVTVKKQQPTRDKRAEEVTGGHQRQQDGEPDRRRETKRRDAEEQNRESSRGKEKSEVRERTRDNSHSGRQKTKGRGQAERISEEDEEDIELNEERNQERSRHSTNRDEVEHLRERPDSSKQLVLVPCGICSRKFLAERLEKHLTVCKNLQQSQRKVYDMHSYRAKGTQNEEFLKNNTRSKTPEMKSKRRQKHQPIAQMAPDYVTCPHCTRRFAPNSAERHIPMCQNIRSRPPPPRCRK